MFRRTILGDMCHSEYVTNVCDRPGENSIKLSLSYFTKYQKFDFTKYQKFDSNSSFVFDEMDKRTVSLVSKNKIFNLT